MINNYKEILKEGMVIKNYLKMCELLNEDIKCGNSKRSQLKEWKRYFDYNIEGQKWIIINIHESPKEKQDLRKLGNTTKHGMRNTLIYGVWKGMKARCFNQNHKLYKHYGGRGITICDEWLNKENGFINFYKWAIENGYKERSGLSIDRIDVNGNYEPNNCRWVDTKIQTINRRTSNGTTIFNNEATKRKIKKDYLIQVVDGLYLSYLIFKNKTYPVGTYIDKETCILEIDRLYKLLIDYNLN